MILYTRQNCTPCAVIKAYLSTRPDLDIEIKEKEQYYSPTYPTLVIGDYYITKSKNILEVLKVMQRHD